MREWIALALLPTVRNRAIKVALVVGTIIAAINYTDKIVGGAVAARDIVKILLTYLVPYCVSTYSAVSALIEAKRKAGR